VYVLLRETASTADTLKAAFCAHMVLHLFEACPHPGSAAATLRAAMGTVKTGVSSVTSSVSSVTSSVTSSVSSAASSVSSAASSVTGGGHGAAAGGAAPAGSGKAAAPAAAGSGGGGKGGAAGVAPAGAAGAAAGAAASPPAPPVLEPWRRLVAGGVPLAGEGRAAHAQRLLEASKPVLDTLYAEFSRQADKQGWKLHNTMLNPRETRLLRVQPLAVT
jgi:hypothetical protein